MSCVCAGCRAGCRPVSAAGRQDNDRPVEITFPKWVTGVVPASVFLGITEGRALMAGVTGGDVPGGRFVGEVLQRQQSANPALKAGIIKLEAIYEVHDASGDHVFTALIRGGTNQATGAALLTAWWWPGGARGRLCTSEFLTIPGSTGCVVAPVRVTCFEGTIHVGRAPNGHD